MMNLLSKDSSFEQSWSGTIELAEFLEKKNEQKTNANLIIAWIQVIIDMLELPLVEANQTYPNCVHSWS